MRTIALFAKTVRKSEILLGARRTHSRIELTNENVEKGSHDRKLCVKKAPTMAGLGCGAELRSWARPLKRLMVGFSNPRVDAISVMSN